MTDCKDPNSAEHKRLWLGNLDPNVTEYQLVKVLQQYGKLEKFDMMYHRGGPHAGSPRGYAFVSYNDPNDAENARKSLNGFKLGARHVAAKWSHTVDKEDLENHKKKDIEIPALVGAKDVPKPSREDQIKAIEKKLKMMEEAKDDFVIGGPSLSTLPSCLSQVNKLKSKSSPPNARKFRSKPYKTQNNRHQRKHM